MHNPTFSAGLSWTGNNATMSDKLALTPLRVESTPHSAQLRMDSGYINRRTPADLCSRPMTAGPRTVSLMTKL